MSGAGADLVAEALRLDRVRRARLSNGLSVLAWPDDAIPNISLYLFYRVGSRNEVPGLTGLSHFFEHMMFNGTRRVGPKQFDLVMERAGGRNNAFTNQDVTVYQDWFPKEALRTVFELEADRMRGLLLDPATIESERGVVLAERKSVVESDNHALLQELLWSTSYTTHPYRWPVIGWSSDISAWKAEDLADYYRRFYAPANALLVVAGDFETDALLAVAEETFGTLPGGDPAPPVGVTEPPQRGERRANLSRPAHLSLWSAAWRVPEARHADSPVLRILETILVSGQSSRLYRRLVDRERAAISVSGGFDLAMDPTLFVLGCEMRDGETNARGEKLLFEEVAALAETPPSEEELAKARRMRLSELYRGLKTVSGRAHEAGIAEVYLGDFAEMLRAARAYETVRGEDILRAARTYLREESRTVVRLDAGGGASS